MPPKKRASRHPALQQQSTLVERIRQSDQADYEALEGWDEFTPLKKQILSLMPYFANDLEAYRYIKPSKTPDDAEVMATQAEALRKLKMRDPLFKEAIDLRKDRRLDLPSEFSANMMGKSVFLLDTWLDDPEVTISDKLKIIKMVQEIQSPIYNVEGNAQHMMANYGDITINFAEKVEEAAQGIKKKIRPAVVEATIVEKE